MDKILLLKNEYTAPSVEILEEALKRRLAALKRIDNEQDHRLNENAGKIDELGRRKLELEKKIAQGEEKSMASFNDFERQNEILKELEHEKTKLIAENRQKEVENNKIKSKCKIPSATDETTLENGRKKFDYYKTLTSIRWDYPMLKSYVKGYVSNKQDYIHPFLFELDDPNLEAKLWEEIARSVASRESE